MNEEEQNSSNDDMNVDDDLRALIGEENKDSIGLEVKRLIKQKEIFDKDSD